DLLPERLRVRRDDHTVADLHHSSHTAGLPVSPVPFVRSVPFGPDCGLTWQTVNGRPHLEVGYHVKASAQGNGFGTEGLRCLRRRRTLRTAAGACGQIGRA